MNVASPRLLVPLVFLAAWGVVTHLSAAESPGQPADSTQNGEPTVESRNAAATAETAAATEGQAVVEEQPQPPGESAIETKGGAETSAGSDPATEEAQAPATETEPVTGAFGIPLGERFAPCMVAKVLGEEERSYRGRDKAEIKGTRYRVEPKVPNRLFQAYSVDTTKDGVIYAIRGEHQSAEKKSDCPVTKRLAAALEEKYGKPRGQGSFGEWYAFRDMSTDLYRGVRLYANRCRRGIYSILYSDDNAKTADPDPDPAPTEISGL